MKTNKCRGNEDILGPLDAGWNSRKKKQNKTENIGYAHFLATALVCSFLI
jgi:hypothetical protein